MRRALLLVVMGLALASAGHASQLEGVALPEAKFVGSTQLKLNGIALRTYSLFEIPIYVAGLYLTRPESDPNKILRSPDMKLLEIHFVHDVSQDESRAAWREGFDRNCIAPCRLRREDVDRFLAAVQAVHKGDAYSILFTRAGAKIEANGNSMGNVTDPAFAEAMLATFIGPHPPTQGLKLGLLGADRQPSQTTAQSEGNGLTGLDSPALGRGPERR